MVILNPQCNLGVYKHIDNPRKARAKKGFERIVYFCLPLDIKKIYGLVGYLLKTIFTTNFFTIYFDSVKIT